MSDAPPKEEEKPKTINASLLQHIDLDEAARGSSNDKPYIIYLNPDVVEHGETRVKRYVFDTFYRIIALLLIILILVGIVYLVFKVWFS